MREVVSATITQDLKTEDILYLENQSCNFVLANKISLEIQLYYKNTNYYKCANMSLTKNTTQDLFSKL